MLKLRRKPGDWVKVTHRSGEVLWVQFERPPNGGPNAVLGFFDPDRNFGIARQEVLAKAKEGADA